MEGKEEGNAVGTPGELPPEGAAVAVRAAVGTVHGDARAAAAARGEGAAVAVRAAAGDVHGDAPAAAAGTGGASSAPVPVCSACGQTGHWRRTRRICPMYVPRGSAGGGGGGCLLYTSDAADE